MRERGKERKETIKERRKGEREKGEVRVGRVGVGSL